MSEKRAFRFARHRLPILIDALIFAAVWLGMNVPRASSGFCLWGEFFLSFACLAVFRCLFRVPNRLRGNDARGYLRLTAADAAGLAANVILERVIPFQNRIGFAGLLASAAVVCLATLTVRFVCRKNDRAGTEYGHSGRDASGEKDHSYGMEQLLCHTPANMLDDATRAYYAGKIVLITGGGGSIGSELCRQIASMDPEKIVILDICENGAYEVQQELRMEYGSQPETAVEILSVCDRASMEAVFAKHRPEIVIHAAAHKHVPLMENNAAEAVINNVFGTLITLETCERFGVRRFMMVSTDKAVNPVSVMGATKRMCEMLTLNRAGKEMLCSATRFGNVLGSAGSVVPLFQKQIAAGGPVTVTDKRVMRYFMTISEASQLVLVSGALAKKNELFVLDMGKPVKIFDLARSMIELSGLLPDIDIEIVETGLRPGEKLYEELLIRGETQDKTDNDLIFIERDQPIGKDELDAVVRKLAEAADTRDNAAVRAALHAAVPTYRTPEEVNSRI